MPKLAKKINNDYIMVGLVAAFCHSGAVYKCHDLLTHLLTYCIQVCFIFRWSIIQRLTHTHTMANKPAMSTSLPGQK